MNTAINRLVCERRSTFNELDDHQLPKKDFTSLYYLETDSIVEYELSVKHYDYFMTENFLFCGVIGAMHECHKFIAC